MIERKESEMFLGNHNWFSMAFNRTTTYWSHELHMLYTQPEADNDNELCFCGCHDDKERCENKE